MVVVPKVRLLRVVVWRIFECNLLVAPSFGAAIVIEV